MLRSKFLMVAGVVVAISGAASAANVTNTQIMQGSCGPSSHLAEGPVGSDLSKRQSRYFCDTAVVMFFDDFKGHALVQFTEKRSHRSSVVGFSGQVQEDGVMMVAPKVYFQPETPTSVDFGTCKFFFKGRNVSGIFCGAKVDENGRRTVISVVFNVTSGQQ